LTECDAYYEIIYYIRGSASRAQQATISNVEWGRRLDEISEAKVTHVLSDLSCCDDLDRIEPWADTAEIYRNGALVWYGWVLSVEYSRTEVIVELKDALIHSRYRILSEVYEKNQDASLHFRDLWNNAMAPNPPKVNIETSLSGVIESRKYTERHKRILWFIVKELLDASIDVTALGNTIYVGPLAIAKPFSLTADDFAGDITLRKAGEYYANQVIVDGARSAGATFPTGVVHGEGIYPLVQDAIYDEGLQTNAAAEAAAKSRYAFTAGVVPRIVRAGDALQLRSGVIEIDRLIPSSIVTLDTAGLCYSQKQDFRLGNVNVTYGGGSETISLSLEPIGTYQKFETITADDDFTSGTPQEEGGSGV